MKQLHLEAGLLAFYSRQLQAEAHSHHAIQLVLHDSGGHDIIASGEPHALTLQQGWVVLLEPQSTLGQQLQQQPQHTIRWLRHYLSASQPDDSVSLPSASEPYPQTAAISDPRLQQLLQQLDGRLSGQCLKPEQWRAHQVAASLALSESRFLHLFRQQMHIAWRPYLLWRRLLCAVQLLNQQQSATSAACAAGFSDSAHLSRTFRRHFGMNIRTASRLMQR